MSIFQHCRSCGGQVSGTAKSCPHCGHVLQKNEPEQKKVSKDWDEITGISGSGPRGMRMTSLRTAVRVGLIATIVGGGTYYAMRSTPQGSNGGSPEEAFVFSQGYVESRLKSPSTADFPAFSLLPPSPPFNQKAPCFWGAFGFWGLEAVGAWSRRSLSAAAEGAGRTPARFAGRVDSRRNSLRKPHGKGR